MEEKPKAEGSGTRVKLSQKDFPQISFESALRIARAIWDHFSGKDAAPHDIAMAIGMAPTSGTWRNLCGSSIAYGLTEGGYASKEINLTDIGRRIVAPTKEGDDLKATIEAVLQPRIMREFYGKYDKAKFPTDNIAVNVLVTMGLPKERAEKAIVLLKENGEFTGIIRETKTGPFIAIDSPIVKERAVEEIETPKPSDKGIPNKISEEDFAKSIADEPTAIPAKEGTKPYNNRVFISHGKNKQIVKQLKEILTFGNFEPVASVERETTSISVPEKVFEDMRSCAAAIIHVMSEEECLDVTGNRRTLINQNVLIEIGASIALYGKNFILLVQKGLELPSNLQGLYRCEYLGEKLDYEATMKLLKIFTEMRKNMT
jgi:predicted nucleotide-binding protein